MLGMLDVNSPQRIRFLPRGPWSPKGWGHHLWASEFTEMSVQNLRNENHVNCSESEDEKWQKLRVTGKSICGFEKCDEKDAKKMVESDYNDQVSL